MSKNIKKKRLELAKYKSRVAEIVDIDESQDWVILHKEGPYVLAHYRDTLRTDKKKYGSMRGIIVDLEAEEIVRQTFSYEPECEYDTIPINADGSVTLRFLNRDFEDKTFPAGTFSIGPGHEAVAIDVWKDKNGKIHMPSLKHPDIISGSSHQPNSLSYYQIWQQLGLPNAKLLFDEKYKSSPFVHTFLLCHPDILMASRGMIGTGYGVYLGWKKMDRKVPEGEDEETFFEPEAVDITKVVDNTSPYIGEVMSAPAESKLIYIPSEISVEAANTILRYGHYESWPDEDTDPRMRTGEFVILTDRTTGLTYRILSSAYYWRVRVRSRHNHLLYGFHRIAHHAIIPRPKAELNKDDDLEQKRYTRQIQKEDYLEQKRYTRQIQKEDRIGTFFPHLSRQDKDKIRRMVEKGVPVVRLDPDKDSSI